MKTQKPFGTWPSPVTTDLVAGKTLRFGLLQSEGDYLYWTECRPAEKGRCVIMRCKTGQPSTAHQPSAPDRPEEILPAPWSCRSAVHEYGGGEFLAHNTILYFVNAEDQQVYRLEPGKKPEQLTPEQLTKENNYRFSDMCLDETQNSLIAVCEIHPEPSPAAKTAHHPENCLAQIHLARPIADRVTILVRGHDFYASPRLSPDTRQLAWLSWNLPDMPWDSAALYVANLDGTGGFSTISQIAGDGTNCVFQPQWHPDGSLYFIWDRTGWGNLYRWQGEGIETAPEHVIDRAADFGQPQWVFGMKKYAILPDGRLALSYSSGGQTAAALFDPGTGEFTEIPPGETGITGLEQLVATGDGFAGLVLSHHQPQAITEISSTTHKTATLRKGADGHIDSEDISVGLPITFQDSDNNTVFGVFYPPENRAYEAAQDDLPPCIFNAHGGPTAAVSRGLNLKIQYWTSRGYGWCDVDYSGSTGYGRDYRKRLDGQWGIADVGDMTAAAKYLASKGKVHPDRCIIAGSSAGGLTVLLALATSDVFAAGASYYGVADLMKLQQTTHKFEAGYLYSLIGCTGDTMEEVFARRSPLAVADQISTPVIFFQGTRDAVVPPEQSQMIHDSLKKRGIPTKLFLYEGEGHGFRQAETIISTLTEEHKFYTRIFSPEEG